MAHPKGVLIERLQKLGLGKPAFQTKATGPDHEPTFLSDVVVKGEVYGTGQGGNKRDAERLAAEEALAFLDEQPVDAPETADADASVDDETSHEAAPDAAPAAAADLDDEGFEGPWPVFEAVLASSLQIAHARINPKLVGDEALTRIRDFALTLYKDVLEDLGEIVETDETDETDPDA